MKLSMTIFFIAGAAAAADGSVATQGGSLRALGKPETTPYKAPPAVGLYKDPNVKPVKPTIDKPDKPPTIDWRCKDKFDPTADDWEASCSGVFGGKDGEDTCQPCCECDCDSSADVPAATAEKTCDVEVEFDTSSTLTCADHDHADPVSGGCADDAVIAACEAICNL